MEGVGGEVNAEEAEREKRGKELEADLVWLARERRKDNRRMLAGILVSLCVAIPMMAMSAHVTDEAMGRGWLYGGLLLGDIGVFGSVMWGLHRGVQRGEIQW